MKLTQAQQRRILEIRAHANLVLQEEEARAARAVADVVTGALDDLAVWAERNPNLTVDEILSGLATTIDHVMEQSSVVMLNLAADAFDVSLITATAVQNQFGTMSPRAVEAVAQSLESEFRTDLIMEGHARWYDRLKGEALDPRGALRSAVEGSAAYGEPWHKAAERLAAADPSFSGLPPRNIDPEARAREIVRTETTRVDNAVSVGFGESAGLKKFQNVGVGDTRQSDVCRRASEHAPMTIEEWNSSGLGVAPRHPNCRCVLIGVYTGFEPSDSLLAAAGVVADDGAADLRQAALPVGGL